MSATPVTGAGRRYELQITLSERATTALRNGDTPAPIFFLAGIAGFLARTQNKSSIAIAHEGRLARLTVDPSLPFSELLTQAIDEMAASKARADTDDDRRVEGPDAYYHFTGHGAINTMDTMIDSAPAFTVEGDRNHWTIRFATEDLTEEQAERNLGYLKSLIECAAADPQQPTATLRLMSEAAALELYRDLNRTETALTPNVTVLDLFAGQAARHGAAEAVLFEGAAMSYTDLDVKSTALATLLIARGANQTQPVAICLPRSEQLPMVLLAVLKAGSYFVPLDPSHPKQRLVDMLEECKPAAVLVSRETQALFADTGLPLFDPFGALDVADPGASLSNDLPPARGDRAYMIYTSGTTGRPKGVIVSHGSLANLLLAMRQSPGLAEGDRVLAVASLSFDISLMDMFLPLISGATLVIASEQAARDPWQLAQLLQENDINCMQATPVMWRMLLASGYRGRGDLPHGLKMISGGEPLSRDLAAALMQMGGELWNCYGPTETTIYSSVLRVTEADGPVRIGTPMPNTVFYVVDAAGQLLPPGIAGELYIGGLGVAEGYFERPELKSERFLADPWTIPSDGKTQHRMFRSGDLVRQAPNGADGFEIFGRIDQQVKLRGYRIELGEIETVLRSHPSLSDAAVLLREDEPGAPWLVGYVTRSSAAEAGVPELRVNDLLDFASQRLPQYMRPSRIVTLPSLPLTGSGKVDRRALAALPAPIEIEEKPRDVETVAAEGPLDETEASLLRIFRDVLRLKSFGPDDNFFEQGGYSLLAIRLFAKIAAAFHVQLPITALFDAPTVRQLAALVRDGNPLQALVPIRKSGNDAPFFLVHSYLLYGLIGNVVEGSRPVYGLREQAPSSTPLNLEQCASDYISAINRVWPTGTVHLGGWCAAAALTMEMARKLMAEGRQVGMIALFDAEAPGFVPRPPSGSRRVARLRAMWQFHLGRMGGLSWIERLQYIQERLTQAPVDRIERFYARHQRRIEKWRRYFSWLPNSFFYNRFTQTSQLQSKQVEALDARIQLFRARDVTVIAGSDPELGWGGIARGGVEVHLIPGHHESMFLDPNIAMLRDKFQASMNRIAE